MRPARLRILSLRTANRRASLVLLGGLPLLLSGSVGAGNSTTSWQADRGIAAVAAADDRINFVNPLIDYDGLNEGHPVTISNDGLPSFGPNPFTAQSYYEDNHYRVRMQRVEARISGAPWVRHSLRFTTIASGTARPLDQGLLVYQAFEGSKVGMLRWGTFAARPISVGFWARASVAGNYAFAIQNLYPESPRPPRHVPDRSFIANFHLDAGRWQFVRLEDIPGDTQGNWIRSGARPALQMGFTLQYPSAPITPGVTLGRDRHWAQSNALAATGQVNLPDHLGATFEFTAIRWNVGRGLADIRPIRAASTEKALMMRNFQKSYPDGVMIGTARQPGNVTWTATKPGYYAARIRVRLKAPLRTPVLRMVPYGQYSGRQGKISIDGLDADPASTSPDGQTGALVVTKPREWRPGDVVEFQWTAEGPWM